MFSQFYGTHVPPHAKARPAYCRTGLVNCCGVAAGISNSKSEIPNSQFLRRLRAVSAQSASKESVPVVGSGAL